jgi:hypothetical protein
VANDSGAQPGWYADPLRRFELRYYNGAAWTADVATGGERFVDPLGVALGPDVGARPGPSTSAQRSTASSASSPSSSDGVGTNSPATAAMVLGIIAVAIAWLPFIVVLGAVAAVLALVFGAMGVRRAGSSGVGRSRAIVGLVTGASGVVVAVLGVALTVIVLDVYDAYLDPVDHETSITTCEVVGSRATATGVLTNLDDEAADFSVLVGFVRPGTDNPHRTSRAVLDDVEPGGSSEFEVARQVELDEVDCIVIDVTGPLPFGVALD